MRKWQPVKANKPKEKREWVVASQRIKKRVRLYCWMSEFSFKDSFPGAKAQNLARCRHPLLRLPRPTPTWNTFSPIRELWFVVCRRSIVIVFTLWMNFKGNSTLFCISATLHDQRGEVVLGKEEGAELLIFIERFSRSNGIIQELL